MKIVVVIPTYNEAENIGKLIPSLYAQFGKFSHHEFHILVVDDTSPDGTGDIVLDLSKEFENVHLLTKKEKEGLGAAYFYAFQYAMKKLDADVLVEMDADLQHRPEDFPNLIEAIDEGYDYVIGSRYINGIDIPKEWAFYRKFLSVAGNLFTKFALGIFNVSDFTTGFKASRVKGFVDKIDFAKVNSSGFAYKMDLLFKMHKMGAKIKEVPIKFGIRDRGDSKMERDNALDSLRVVLRLRYQASKSFVKFVFVGFAGLFVDSSIFSIVGRTSLGFANASFISGLAGMITTYTLNNLWSFGDRKKINLRSNAKAFPFYAASSYLPIIFRSWLIGYAESTYGQTYLVSYSAFFIGIMVGLIWNYLIYSRVIWKKK